MNKITLIVMISVFFIFIPIASYQQENTGSVKVIVVNENGDRVDPDILSVKVYQDFNTTPFREISRVTENPIMINLLPIGHDYKFEIYMNSMYGDVGYVELEKDTDQVKIVIRNAGGIRLSVFYNDGETPLPNANVWIKSFDGKIWGYSNTDTEGKTVRMWLAPTTKDSDYYLAEITLGPDLKYVQTPVSIHPGVAQEIIVTTKWPKSINKLITVEVYNSTSKKVSKPDGKFLVQLFDDKKNMTSESAVSDRGTATFSKLKVGNYIMYVKSKSEDKQSTEAVKKITLTGSEDIFKIYLHNPELNSDNLNCNCVAFRLDDIQDYYLSGAQMDILKIFEQKHASLTIGVIANAIGSDPNLMSLIKNAQSDPSFDLEVANHGLSHRVMTSLTRDQQEDDVIKSNKRIQEIFGVTPVTYIPPENVFNDDTIDILKKNNFTNISYHTATTKPPLFQKSDFYHFPADTQTSILNRPEANWQVQPIGKIMDRINDSMITYGYAVVMMHPHEFSTYSDGIYQNKVNQTQVQQTRLLIDKVKDAGYRIVTIDGISKFNNTATEKPLPINNTKSSMPNCNCVAFRMDNIQDFYLNDVQNAVISKFGEKRSPVTISIIGKFFGSDSKTVNVIKEQIQKDMSLLHVANRGWEYLDHATYDKDKQAASIAKTNAVIFDTLGINSTVFAPPLDSFNQDTVNAAIQNKMQFFSASISKDRPPYSDSLEHVPSTLLFTNLISDDPFYAGTIPEKAILKVKTDIEQHGYAVISLQAQDFAIRENNIAKNEINPSTVQLLDTLLQDLNSNGIKIVMLDKIPALLENKSIIIPEWIKNNARWWSEGQVDDKTFASGIQYLLKERIIVVPATEKGAAQNTTIPEWVKNNARWWALDQIDDKTFASGIQFLVKVGIINV